jgi:hypothetical protein
MASQTIILHSPVSQGRTAICGAKGADPKSDAQHVDQFLN